MGVGFIALGLLIAAYRLTHRALPVIDGTLRVQGLEGRAEIIRDRWGIPHIFADHDEDASFALGFATAQDRLFQMDLTRGPSPVTSCTCTSGASMTPRGLSKA